MNSWNVPHADLSAWVTGPAGHLWTAVLDAVDDMVFIKDLEGRFVFNNAAHLEFLKKSRAEVVGQSDFDLFRADEAQIFFAHDTRVLETKSPVVSAHPARDAADRAVIDVAFKHVIQGPGDEIVGLVGIVKRMPVGTDCGACRNQVIDSVRRALGDGATASQLSALRESVDGLLQAKD